MSLKDEQRRAIVLDAHGCFIPSLDTPMCEAIESATAAPLLERIAGLEQQLEAARKAAPATEVQKERLALNVQHQDCHKAADAFWAYWKANGETHKRGYYESTWGAINRALRTVGVVEHKYSCDAAISKEQA